MARTNSLAARREVTAAVAERYRAAGHREKGRILVELCATTGWHRQHAVRVLRAKAQSVSEPRPRQRRYGAAIKDALVALWDAPPSLSGSVIVTGTNPDGDGGAASGFSASPYRRRQLNTWFAFRLCWRATT